MASQRVTVAKVGGVAAEIVVQRLREWSAARQPGNRPNEWSSEQWPRRAREQADELADRLRANAFGPPVIYFTEWADMWSMGDLFERWLTPPDGPMPLMVYADRYQVYGYSLPDGGRLERYLATAGPQQWPETDWFVARLREAVCSWQGFVEQAALVVLRHVVGGSALDEEVTASLRAIPDWLSRE